MTTTTINKVKVGTVIKFKLNGKRYVRSSYDFRTKLYNYYDYERPSFINKCHADTFVYVDPSFSDVLPF